MLKISEVWDMFCNLYLVVGKNDCVWNWAARLILLLNQLWELYFETLNSQTKWAVEKALVAVALSNIRFVAFTALSIGQAMCIDPPAV